MAQAEKIKYSVVEGWEQPPKGYVAPNGTLFCTDDGQHTVRQFTPEGKLLMTPGVLNTPSDTGCHAFQKFSLRP